MISYGLFFCEVEDFILGLMFLRIGRLIDWLVFFMVLGMLEFFKWEERINMFVVISKVFFYFLFFYKLECVVSCCLNVVFKVLILIVFLF